MILKAYSVFDNKALQYHQPFFTSTDGAATRMVRDLVEDNNTQLGRHPSDFSLWFVGTWDDQHARFDAVTPVHVVDAVALVPAPVTPLFRKEA